MNNVIVTTPETAPMSKLDSKKATGAAKAYLRIASHISAKSPELTQRRYTTLLRAFSWLQACVFERDKAVYPQSLAAAHASIILQTNSEIQGVVGEKAAAIYMQTVSAALAAATTEGNA